MKKPLFSQTFTAAVARANPFNEVELDVVFRHESGQSWKVPAFWRGGKRWEVRFYAPLPGCYEARTHCSDPADSGLHAITFDFTISDAAYEHPLYRHGRLKTEERRFVYEDGTPFTWLGDTWWMALGRMDTQEIAELAKLRKEQGFTLVQLVAGLFPDMAPFDPRGGGEEGFVWQKGFEAVNPAWFDEADKKLEQIIDAGLTPVILGGWGYYLGFMGEERMRRHWRYLIARWGAWPVIWVAAGEVSMPWYLSQNREREHRALKEGWSRMCAYIRQIDPYDRLLSAHPSHMAHRELSDPSSLDFEMLQTGHGDEESVRSAAITVAEAQREVSNKPVVMAEVTYEGILGRNGADVVEKAFWVSILNGASGFTYGANGIWQVNRPDRPFGKSPSGGDWGKTPWREAMTLPGAQRVGAGMRFLQEMSELPLTPCEQNAWPFGKQETLEGPFFARNGKRLLVCYGSDGGFLRRIFGFRFHDLLPNSRYRIDCFNPQTGEKTFLKTVVSDQKGDLVVRHRFLAKSRVLALVLEPTDKKSTLY
ncbi:MAG: DUF4038 domain-containing protein [Epsilonproteobacteria bacterium]|nr:DUF4038 domain-containing protein [Campylobacterota bacterium]